MTSQITVGSPAYKQILHRWRHLCDLANSGTLTKAERKELDGIEHKLAEAELAYGVAQAGTTV